MRSTCRGAAHRRLLGAGGHPVSSGGIGGLKSYADSMLDLNALDVEEIATALADQTDYEHR